MSTPEFARPLRVFPAFPLRLFLLSFIAVLLGAGLLAVRAPLPALTFNASAFSNLGQVFAPMLLIATFVERAVEVLLTPLRGEGSDRLQARLDAAEKAGSDAALLSQLQQDLASYKNRSREIAFIMSSALGLIAALMAAIRRPSLPSAGYRWPPSTAMYKSGAFAQLCGPATTSKH